MTSTELQLWAAVAVFNVAGDTAMMYLKLNGLMGKRNRAYSQSAARLLPGGIAAMAAVGIAFDILLAPLAVFFLLFTWSRNWRWYIDELKRSS